MKANEFVKKYGWGEAKELVARHEKCYLPDVFDMWSDKLQDFVLCTKYASFNISDLKRLVESHELVEKLGGLETAKKELQRQSILRWINPETERVRVAIADVESCL